MTEEEQKWYQMGYDDQCWGYPLLDHVWKKKSLFNWKPKYPIEYQSIYRKGQIDAYEAGHARDCPWFHPDYKPFVFKE